MSYHSQRKVGRVEPVEPGASLDSIFPPASKNPIVAAYPVGKDGGEEFILKLRVSILSKSPIAHSGAAVVAANKLAVRAENKGKLIACILPSFGERWVSIPIFVDMCFSQEGR